MLNIINKEDNNKSFHSDKKNINLAILRECSFKKNLNQVPEELNKSCKISKKKKCNSKKNLPKIKIIPPSNNNNLLTPINHNNNNKNFYNFTQNITSTILSKTPKSDSIKLRHLEKSIQQTIISISMKIEKESTIIGMPNDNNMKVSTLIKQKIDKQNILDCLSSHRNNKSLQNTPKNKSILTKKVFTDKYEETIDNSLKPLKSKSSCIIPKLNKTLANNKDKFRKLLHKNMVYDSFDSEEDEEFEGIFFPTNDSFIQFIDLLIIFSSLFYMVYTPYYLSNIKYFCTPLIKSISCIYYFIDFLYIIDLILGFFRAYHNFQFQIIKNNVQIIKHYLFTQFFLDLIQAIPFFTYISYFCYKNECDIKEKYNMNDSHLILILCINIKQLKIFKITNIKKNSIFYELKQIVSKKDSLENLFTFFLYTIFCIFAFYFFISIHIFIGENSYPNWIINSGSEDKSFYSLYLTSFYFLITTMTTVGYGDLVCASSFREIFFQLILLSAGITVYSWIVSNIGNYVKNESYASIKFNKDESILEEIRILYPNMSFKLYKKIYHHLGLRRIRQRQCDSNLLINSLPHSLKYQILLAMYKQTIKNFKIFRGNQNTDFTVRLLTNFIPLFAKKNAFLIHEGQLIDNVIFVKEGRLALEASIDIKEPDKSVKQYLNKNFCDINEDVVIVSDYENSLETSKLNENNYNNIFGRAQDELKSVLNDNKKTELNSSINESNIIKEIGKWDFGGDAFEKNDIEFINIINISKNESFGDVYMFLSKPSPLSLRVKSKKAELFLLRKNDASDISIRYPNIWANFFKKSYINMLSIKALTIRKIKYYWKNLGKQLYKELEIKKKQTIIEKVTYKEEKRNSIFSKAIPKICFNDGESQNIDKEIFSLSNSKKSAQNSDSIKYISFGKGSSKNLYLENNCRSCLNPQQINLKGESSKESSNNKKILNTYVKNNLKFSRFILKKELESNEIKRFEPSNQLGKKKNIKSIRMDYLKKLKKKIKKLEKSKKYYKDMCKKLNDNSTKNISNILNEKKTYNSDKNHHNNNNIYNSFEKRISSSSYSSSQSKFKKFSDIDNDLVVTSSINLEFQAKYKNLEKLTLGEYSKNRNLREVTQKFIQFYLSKFSKIKKEDSFEPNISTIFPLKCANFDYFLTSTSLYSDEKRKLDIQKKNSSNPSLNKILTKKTNDIFKEGQYIIILDTIKNSFYLYGKSNNSYKNYSPEEKKWKMRRLSSSASKVYGKYISEDSKIKKLKRNTINKNDFLKKISNDDSFNNKNIIKEYFFDEEESNFENNKDSKKLET